MASDALLSILSALTGGGQGFLQGRDLRQQRQQQGQASQQQLQALLAQFGIAPQPGMTSEQAYGLVAQKRAEAEQQKAQQQAIENQIRQMQLAMMQADRMKEADLAKNAPAQPQTGNPQVIALINKLGLPLAPLQTTFGPMGSTATYDTTLGDVERARLAEEDRKTKQETKIRQAKMGEELAMRKKMATFESGLQENRMTFEAGLEKGKEKRGLTGRSTADAQNDFAMLAGVKKTLADLRTTVKRTESGRRLGSIGAPGAAIDTILGIAGASTGGASVRSPLAAVRTAIRKAISGAAISPSEGVELAGLLPSIWRGDKEFAAKMDELDAYVNRLAQSRVAQMRAFGVPIDVNQLKPLGFDLQESTGPMPSGASDMDAATMREILEFLEGLP